MKLSIQALIAVSILITAAVAAETPSIQKGNELFKSAAIATNGRSCASCHPDGKGLDDLASYDGKALGKTINQCLVKALNGKALAEGSLELDSLVMYLKSLGAASTK